MAPGDPEAGGPPARPRLTPEAFAEQFRAAERVLWTVAAGILGDPTEAEDVLQEAATMALTKLQQFDPTTQFTAWMGTFVRNVALNVARKRARRNTRSSDPEELAQMLEESTVAPVDSPVDAQGRLQADQGAFDDRVMAGLDELRGVARAALLLRTVNGLSYREIGVALGIREGTAMSHVHRARQAMRQHLADSAKLDPTTDERRGGWE